MKARVIWRALRRNGGEVKLLTALKLDKVYYRKYVNGTSKCLLTKIYKEIISGSDVEAKSSSRDVVSVRR
jgi:hypothetical protein